MTPSEIAAVWVILYKRETFLNTQWSNYNYSLLLKQLHLFVGQPRLICKDQTSWFQAHNRREKKPFKWFTFEINRDGVEMAFLLTKSQRRLVPKLSIKTIYHHQCLPLYHTYLCCDEKLSFKPNLKQWFSSPWIVTFMMSSLTLHS